MTDVERAALWTFVRSIQAIGHQSFSPVYSWRRELSRGLNLDCMARASRSFRSGFSTSFKGVLCLLRHLSFEAPTKPFETSTQGRSKKDACFQNLH